MPLLKDVRNVRLGTFGQGIAGHLLKQGMFHQRPVIGAILATGQGESVRKR